MKTRHFINRLTITTGVWLLMLVLPTLGRGGAEVLEERLGELTTQIAAGMNEGNKKKIAVIEFSDLDGRVTDLGKYISEELITRLFMTKKYEVIERLLLNRVVEEHKLTLTGLVDQRSAEELGKILGVDAICSGTVTDLGDSVKVNARLISAETGSIFAVAAVLVEKDDTISMLMSQTAQPRSSMRKSGSQNEGSRTTTGGLNDSEGALVMETSGLRVLFDSVRVGEDGTVLLTFTYENKLEKNAIEVETMNRKTILRDENSTPYKLIEEGAMGSGLGIEPGFKTKVSFTFQAQEGFEETIQSMRKFAFESAQYLLTYEAPKPTGKRADTQNISVVATIERPPLAE